MSAAKLDENITNILNLAIRLKIYIWKTKFSFHNQYLFGLFFSRNAKKAHTDQSIQQTFLFCLKRNVSQTFESSSGKSLFQVCISLIQLDSMIIFYSMWQLKDIIFLYKFIVTQWFAATIMLLRSFKQVFWKMSTFYISIISTITLQCC